MSRRALVGLLVLGLAPLGARAQEPVSILRPGSDGAAKTVTSSCSGGVVYDDGSWDAGYGLGSNGAAVMKLDLPGGSTGIDQACICFVRNSSGPSSMNFSVVVYDDDGPGGQPGTLLATVPATATGLLVNTAGFFSVATPGVTVPNTGVFVGAKWGNVNVFICGDTSTSQRTNFASTNGGSSWSSFGSIAFNPPVPAPHALMIRADPKAGTCVPSATAMCLNGNRFKVEATFQVFGQPQGTAQAVKITEDTGYLWFFGSNNNEVVLKVLNGCALNNHYWVYAGGLTDVRVDIKVTDTLRGGSKTYTNPLGTKFQPIQDVDALATCP
jgi:hypothetical protein